MSKHWDIFRNVNEFVRFSDTKAAVVLAFAGGSAAFLSSKVAVIHDIIVAHHADFFSILLCISATFYIFSLVATIVFAFRSIWPSLESGDGRSLIYFKHICEDFKHDHQRYAKALADLDDAAMEGELAHQICVNATIATKKFELVGRAIRSFAITGGFWAITVFLILLLGTTAAPK